MKVSGGDLSAIPPADFFVLFFFQDFLLKFFQIFRVEPCMSFWTFSRNFTWASSGIFKEFSFPRIPPKDHSEVPQKPFFLRFKLDFLSEKSTSFSDAGNYYGIFPNFISNFFQILIFMKKKSSFWNFLWTLLCYTSSWQFMCSSCASFLDFKMNFLRNIAPLK